MRFFSSLQPVTRGEGKGEGKGEGEGEEERAHGQGGRESVNSCLSVSCICLYQSIVNRQFQLNFPAPLLIRAFSVRSSGSLELRGTPDPHVTSDNKSRVVTLSRHEHRVENAREASIFLLQRLYLSLQRDHLALKGLQLCPIFNAHRLQLLYFP